MRVHDKAGNALPHARQWSELSIFFYAGERSNAILISYPLHDLHTLYEHVLINLEDLN